MIPLEDSLVLDAKVLASSEKYSLCYKKGKLFRFELLTNKLSGICSLPNTKANQFLTRISLAERLLRLEPRASVALSETEFLFSYSGCVYCIDVISGELRKEHAFRTGMNNPLSFVKIKSLSGFEDSIVYGEYFCNNQYDDVCIWQRTGSGEWRKTYSFPAGSIYHIHSIVPDYKNSCLYVLTGDKDSESGIWKVSEQYSKVERILGGIQQNRSCVAFPYKEGLLYATDTPREANHLFYASCQAGEWSIEPKYTLAGPCIFGLEQTGIIYFSTSVEGDDTMSDFRYRFTYKLGAGVQDRSSHVISVDSEWHIEELCSFKKDILPMLLFQFGNCQFPYNESVNYLMLCPQSVRKYHGKTIIINVSKKI